MDEVEAYDRGYNEGYDSGYRDGRSEMDSEIADLNRRIDELESIIDAIKRELP